MSLQLKKKFFLFAIGAFAVLILILLLSLFTKTAAPPNPVQPSPTLVPKLSPYEKTYPEATPQEFSPSGNRDVGTLIVDSTPPETRVLIDAPNEEVPDVNNPKPVNITPFKISTLPVGSYILTASKQGYNFTTVSFTIKKDKVTSLTINLVPQEEGVGY